MDRLAETALLIGTTGALTCVVVAMALTVIRLIRGPSRADRVVALDLVTILAVALIGGLAVATDVDALLDVAIALALVAFLGTVALARALGRSAGANRDPSA